MVPFYDVTKPGLSFKLDKQAVSGMWEVPGKPQHFLVLGYFGFIWSLYPDTTKTYAPGAIKDYTKKQIGDFNNVVRKGFEQGALGGAFDPDFIQNRYFYTIYHKYDDTSQYKPGVIPKGNGDGPGEPGLVAVDRWILSRDLATLTRDTTIFQEVHGQGYGSANMVFGKDNYLYISCHAYSKNSWDLTDPMRKILRIDVSRPANGKMYSIPPTNPFANSTDPKVRKEIFAYGFRNTHSLAADYLTGSIWGGEVGQTEWEEVNIIQAGKNYGWANGGDGQPSRNGAGVEGPCSPNTDAGIGFSTTPTRWGYLNPYSFIGPESDGKKVTCSDLTNGTWNFQRRGMTPHPGMKTAVPNLEMNCIMLSPAFRGSPSSPFYGYHFVTDVQRMYFIAVKEGIAEADSVGGAPDNFRLNESQPHHNGITSFGEDSYGNLYVTLLSSSRSGAYEWHDLYRLSHPALTPLSSPRTQVVPTTRAGLIPGDGKSFRQLPYLKLNGSAHSSIPVPEGFTRVEVHALDGTLLWKGSLGDRHVTQVHRSIDLPHGLRQGLMAVRFWP